VECAVVAAQAVTLAMARTADPVKLATTGRASSKSFHFKDDHKKFLFIGTLVTHRLAQQLNAQLTMFTRHFYDRRFACNSK